MSSAHRDSIQPESVQMWKYVKGQTDVGASQFAIWESICSHIHLLTTLTLWAVILSHLRWKPCAHIRSRLTLRSAKSKCHFNAVSWTSGALLWFALAAHGCLPTAVSDRIPRFDGWTLRRLVLHSEHTHIVFVPATFPLPDRRPGVLHYDPHGNMTQADITADRTRTWGKCDWMHLFLGSVCFLGKKSA